MSIVDLQAYAARRKWDMRIIGEVGALGGVVSVIYSVCAFSHDMPYPTVSALVPTVGAALVILFATPKTAVGKLLVSKLFVAIGLVSYSGYLIHQPMFAFARYRLLGDLGWPLASALAAAAFALAYMNWKYIELPFRNRTRFSQRQIFTFGPSPALSSSPSACSAT